MRTTLILKVITIERIMKRVLRGPAANSWGISAEAIRHASQTAYWQMRAFYLIAFFAAFDFLQRIYSIALSDRELEPLWPVIWANWVGLESAVRLIGLFLIISAFIALWWPASRWPRILVFIGFLQFSALDNSFGSINHYAHYLIWISLLMIFFPAGGPPQQRLLLTQHYVYIFSIFITQCFIGLFYTLSGLHKFMGGVRWSSEQVSTFHPDALPLLIMGRWETTGNTPMLSEVFASNLFLAWPGFLLVIYMELTFLLAVFRPQLHRFYGVSLAIFHIGVWLAMGIDFDYQPVLVALFFIWSPFAYFDKGTYLDRIVQMPGVDVASWLAHYLRIGRLARRGSGAGT